MKVAELENGKWFRYSSTAYMKGYCNQFEIPEDRVPCMDLVTGELVPFAPDVSVEPIASMDVSFKGITQEVQDGHSS